MCAYSMIRDKELGFPGLNYDIIECWAAETVKDFSVWRASSSVSWQTKVPSADFGCTHNRNACHSPYFHHIPSFISSITYIVHNLVKMTLRSAARPRRALARHSANTCLSSGTLQSHLCFTPITHAIHSFLSHSHVFHLWVTWPAKCPVNAS